jgi:hypothetical protein
VTGLDLKAPSQRRVEPYSSMAVQAEFDPAIKVLLLRFEAQFEGQLTDESIAEFFRVIRKYWIAADARWAKVKRAA